MQSGIAATKQWVLEYEADEAPPKDALMGWTGSHDTRRQVRLSFNTRDDAISFAVAKGIPHQVLEPRERKPVIKAYGDNFAFKRREPWSH